MRTKWVRGFIWVTLALALAVLPPLACSSNSTDKAEVVIGWLGDFTGSASTAMIPVYDGFMDYLDKAEEEGLLEAKPKVVIYDTRTEYGRTPVGYQALKNAGAQVMVAGNPYDLNVLVSKLEVDQMPAISSVALDSLLESDWCYFLMSPIQEQTRLQMKYLVEHEWDYEGTGRNPKIGLVGGDIAIGQNMRDAIEEFLADNPGKVDWKGARLAPISSTSWFAEALALKDCDYIVVGTVGPSTASFIRDARISGYTEKLMSGTSSIPGYWNLVKSAVNADLLYDVYHVHVFPWVGSNPFNDEVTAALQANHSASYAAVESDQSAYPSGWALGIWMVDVLQRALASVDGDPLTGLQIRNAMATTDMEVEAWGNRWTLTEDNHVCARSLMVFGWDVDEARWVEMSDWIMPED